MVMYRRLVMLTSRTLLEEEIVYWELRLSTSLLCRDDLASIAIESRKRTEMVLLMDAHILMSRARIHSLRGMLSRAG